MLVFYSSLPPSDFQHLMEHLQALEHVRAAASVVLLDLTLAAYVKWRKTHQEAAGGHGVVASTE
jgi:hypothetical protein